MGLLLYTSKTGRFSSVGMGANHTQKPRGRWRLKENHDRASLCRGLWLFNEGAGHFSRNIVGNRHTDVTGDRGDCVFNFKNQSGFV